MGTDLLAATAELVAVPSLSHHEGPLADRVERDLRACAWLEVTRLDDNVVARTRLGRARRVVMAGHLDTVPPATGTVECRLVDGTLHGVGSADMKGGLAVMLDLARTIPEPSVDVTWCFYACEEVDRASNGLRRLFEARPDLVAGDAAVLGEPTDGRVEAGCQGTMRAVVRVGGVRAHTARPFTGRNAVHRLAPVLGCVAGWRGRSVELAGCEYVEQLQAVAVEGGVAGNVVPDAASVTVNYRFAPDRGTAEARQHLASLFGPLLDDRAGDSLEVVDEAAGAPPALDAPVLGALLAATGRPPKAKVGWTDVATFWEHGVPAANFGPGDPLLAHHPDEHVDGAQLDQARRVLAAVLTAG